MTCPVRSRGSNLGKGTAHFTRAIDWATSMHDCTYKGMNRGRLPALASNEAGVPTAYCTKPLGGSHPHAARIRQGTGGEGMPCSSARYEAGQRAARSASGAAPGGSCAAACRWRRAPQSPPAPQKSRCDWRSPCPAQPCCGGGAGLAACRGCAGLRTGLR